MSQVAAVPPLAYLLALAEDPCTWLLIYFVFKEVIIPAVRKWRAKRMEKKVVTETTEK